MKKYLVVNKNFFFKKKLKNTKERKFFFITNKKDLNLKKVNKINPNFIFFPHWSWKINSKILKKYNCVGFHSTPLPFGRGGSPIQNMVLKGYKKTKICAFQIVPKLDSGPIYLRANLDLSGDGYFIFNNMYKSIYNMIVKLIRFAPKPKAQKGKITKFKRLSKANSEINKNLSFNNIYNLIRALDMRDKNYLNAYIKLKNIKVSFTEAKLKKNKIIAKAIFKKINF